MASNNDLYVKITKNNSEVFIKHTMISETQLKQIKSKDIRIQVNVSKLKIKNLCPPKATITSNITNNSRLVLNYVNNSNALNCLTTDNNKRMTTRPKRKLKADPINDKCNGDQKKAKCVSKTTGLNLNVSEALQPLFGSQRKNKENRNNSSPELSRVIGLPNMGNTCYINSIIQGLSPAILPSDYLLVLVLRMTPGFRQFVCSLNKTIDLNKYGLKLKSSNKELISSLHKIFVHFGDNEVNFDKTNLAANESKITDLIECDDIKNRFEFGQQQDCHEFLNWLINELNSFAELLFPNKNNGKNLGKSSYNTRRKNSEFKQSMTFQNFQGVMLRNIMCNECNKSSSTHDSFADIQIPLCVTEEVTDICETQSFSDIIHRKDYLKDDNMFDCGYCSRKTNAFVINTIEIPPKVLIIFIKKPFEYNQIKTRNVKPMKKLFTVPLSLEYSSGKRSIRYSLYGFVMHTGSDTDNGHYYAVIDSELLNKKRSYKKKMECNCSLNVLANNGWIKVNDHKVSKLNTSHLNRLLDNDNIASTPYLAFYQRND